MLRLCPGYTFCTSVEMMRKNIEKKWGELLIYKENSGDGDEDEKVKVEGEGEVRGKKRKEEKKRKKICN